MAFVSVYKTVTVTPLTSPHMIAIGNITGPSFLLAVTVDTITAADDAIGNGYFEIGTIGPGTAQFNAFPFARITSDSIWAAEKHCVVQSPDFALPGGELPNKPQKWGILWVPNGETSIKPWKGKVTFHMVK